jgi:ribosomal protein S18 acetylase RimI-like enzyme
VEVRQAQEADARGIAVVHIESWRAAYVGLVPDDFLAQMSLDQREAMWQEILAAMDWPTRGTVVLVDGETVAGFASTGPSRDHDAAPGTGEVWGIYLLPGTWGLGAGRQLMSEALARLRAAGFDQATLWVLARNERARHFYEAGGWSSDGVERTEARPGFELHEVRYRRPL